MKKIYLSLGSNLGRREKNIEKAIATLAKKGLKIKKKSRAYETEPFGVKNQPWFINMCLEAQTSLDPEAVLALCKETEREIGRQNRARWHEREIDIDLLYYENIVIKTETLEIPHPGIAHRNFVLIPLAEIAPEFKPLLSACNDRSIVRAISL